MGGGELQGKCSGMGGVIVKFLLSLGGLNFNKYRKEN